MPEVATLLCLSERAARDWVKRHDLPLRGTRPVRVAEDAVLVAMEAEAREPRNSPEASRATPGSSPEAPGSTEPIEATYRVAREGAAVALVPLATMVEELRGLAAQLNDMARRNEALALEVGQLRERQGGQAAQLTAQGETIDELRRRAAVAEEEVARRRREEAERWERVRALVREREAASGIRRSGSMLRKHLNQVSDEQEAQEAWGAAPPAPRAPTFWERVRARLWGE